MGLGGAGGVGVAGELDFHQVDVATVFQEGLTAIKVFVASPAKFVARIRDVTLGWRGRRFSRAIWSLNGAGLFILFLK